MGDVAMTSPIVSELRKNYPDLKITVLTRPFFKPFYRDIENISFVDIDMNRHKGFFGVIRLYMDILREGKPTMAADLHNVIITKGLRILLRLGGTRVVVINKGRKEKKELIQTENKVLKPLKTTAQRYVEVLNRLGFKLSLPNKIEHKDAEIPEQFGRKECTWIGIAPFAQHQGKIYPIEKMRRVVETLSGNKSLKMFVFGGGASEKTYAESLASSFDNVVSVIGNATLSEELDLISNLDVMVSMDSAAMHMASLQGVRVISIWGATHPYAGFLGVGQTMSDAIQINLPCRPCSIYGNKPCEQDDYACMEMIDPKNIVSKINQVVLSTK